MFKLCSARPRARQRGGDLALDMLETHVIPGGRVVICPGFLSDIGGNRMFLFNILNGQYF